MNNTKHLEPVDSCRHVINLAGAQRSKFAIHYLIDAIREPQWPAHFYQQ